LGSAADFYTKLEGRLQGLTDAASRAALATSYLNLAEITAQFGKGSDANGGS
jgi:hypothetical protein